MSYSSSRRSLALSCRMRASAPSYERAAGRRVSLQDSYRDISRLLQLAYPGEDSKFTQCKGNDSFIASLNDSSLVYEILKRDPPSLQEAANYARGQERETN